VWETDRFELVVPIRNNSAASVRLTEWRNSCNCLSVEPPSLEFGPDETKPVTVTIDLASKLRMNPTAAQVVAVPLSGTLGDGTTVSWRIRGVVKPLVKTYPDLSLPLLSELAQPYPGRHVDLEFIEPVLIESLDSDSPFVTASLRESAAATRTACPIELKLDGAIPIGEHRFTLSVQGTVGSSRQRVVKLLGGVVRVAPDVQGDPGQVVFPAKTIGDESEETVVLKSLTGRGVSIEAVAVEGEGLATDWVKGGSALVVRQRSTKAGQVTTRVRVVVRSEGRASEVVIPVTSLGINQ
jgi:hypothetical protein